MAVFEVRYEVEVEVDGAFAEAVPLIGREAETARLRERLQGAAAGRGGS